MTDQKTVLVTGAAGFWGSRVAAQLMAKTDFHVIGLDKKQPKEPVKGLDFIQADIRNALLLELLKSEAVHTVCHLAFIESQSPNEAALEVNVMGTMRLFGSCAQSGVKKIVIRSSTAVYGANPTNSAFLTEEHPLQGAPGSGTVRDLVDIESFCNGFRRQSPEILVTLLRFPGIIGPSVNSPLTQYLKDPLAPTLFGFDPMLQVLHESDAVDALVHAVLQDQPGVFNVAAEGVVPLNKLIGMTGKLQVPVFHLFAYWSSSFLGGSLRPLKNIPYGPDYIRYPWVGDLTRMRNEMGFTPRYTAEETLREFAGYLRTRSFRADISDLNYDEERLNDTIKRHNRTHIQRTDKILQEDEGNE